MCTSGLELRACKPAELTDAKRCGAHPIHLEHLHFPTVHQLPLSEHPHALRRSIPHVLLLPHGRAMHDTPPCHLCWNSNPTADRTPEPCVCRSPCAILPGGVQPRSQDL